MANSITLALTVDVLKIQDEKIEDDSYYVLTVDLGDDITKVWIKRTYWFEHNSAAPEKGELTAVFTVSVKTRGGFNGAPVTVVNELKFRYQGPASPAPVASDEL